MVRNPAVAGQFYSLSGEALSKEVRDLLKASPGKREDPIGILSPHAGYIYSGPVAGATFASIIPKSTYVIMGPNHTGLGSQFSVSAADTWKTPLGEAKVDKRLAQVLMKNCPEITVDELSHLHEHSIEVQLPFLQAIQKEFTFLPIVISSGSAAVYKKIGEAIAGSVKELKMEKDTAIIASSDMTHYESHESAGEKDARAIDAVLKLDGELLMERIREFDISMCGYGPATIMIAAAKALGAKGARLVRYQTSADASGDYSSVVGYAGIVIS